MPEPSKLFPADNPAVTKHVDVLQGIINRLANNSSSCKSWCLTLVGALLSLAGATKVPAIAAFIIVPILMFRYIDSRYLAQERAYRRKYNALVKHVRDDTYDRAHVFDATEPFTDADVNAALKSWAIRPVYNALIAIYVLYFVLWFVDWKFGYLGGFFALPSSPPPRATP